MHGRTCNVATLHHLRCRNRYPTSWGGDWSPACRQRFRAAHGEDMPEELGTPACEGKGAFCQPVATDKRVLDLMRQVTQEYFANLTAAVTRSAAGGRVVSLVSTFFVPGPADGWSPTAGGGVFETSALLRSPGDTVAAKTELRKGSRSGAPSPAAAGDRLDEASLDSLPTRPSRWARRPREHRLHVAGEPRLIRLRAHA